jgi:hypothetical protein
MILRTPDIHPKINGTRHSSSSSQPPLQTALDLAADVAARYESPALSGLLASARTPAAQDEVSLAVLGRFKAGKSSFLNHFIGRNILPVGVVPVTAAVTEIRYGAREEARVHHRDGRDPEVPLDQIGDYISEKENPENTKQAGALRDELTVVSIRERSSFLAPVHKVTKQAFRALQQFRDRLSGRAMRAFGVPLRTTETEINVAAPSTADIRIGRVFDRNWEFLSSILPVWMIKGIVRRHFARIRRGSQWVESINGVLWEVEKEARRRLDELIGTVERLVESSSNEQAPQLRADLERLEKARESLAAEIRN